MLGAERVFKYKKIKVKVSCLSGNYYEVPHSRMNFHLENLLYGEFGYKSNEYEPSEKKQKYFFEPMRRTGIEVLGMTASRTKDGKYTYLGLSNVELKEACQKNGIKGLSKCNKTELVKFLMKVDCIEEPKKKKKNIIKKKKAQPVIEEVKPVIEEDKPVIEEDKPVIEGDKPVIEVAKPVEAEDFYKLFGDKFIYCGIHLSTEGFKADGKPRKKPSLPFEYDKINKPLIKNFKVKGKDIKPNGIILLQEKSNYSSIDVDIPEECEILQQLFKDCHQIHKTKNSFHFIFKSNDFPRSTCGVVDINTNLFFVPEYKNENNEVVGKYEIIKNDGLIERPEYVYKYCEK